MPDGIYHVYNHAVSTDNLFRTDENYLFFLKKYAQYIAPIADTFAYILLPNHFHFALRIKSERELAIYFESIGKQWNKTPSNPSKTLPEITSLTLPEFQTLAGLEGLVSLQFSHMFNSYTQSFNKMYNRKGTLFRKPFRRLHIDSDAYFREIIHYIHHNPVHHGFTNDLRDWKFSSFESYFSEKASLLKRHEVIEWFHDKDNFYAFHQKKIDDRICLELEF
jgi:putative transposase